MCDGLKVRSVIIPIDPMGVVKAANYSGQNHCKYKGKLETNSILICLVCVSVCMCV